MKVTNDFIDKYVGESGVKVSNTNNSSILITNTYGLYVGLSFNEAKDLYDILGAIVAKESNGRK